MMVGLIYVISLWVVWIYATFMMGKDNHLRLPLAFFALIMLIIMPFSLSIFNLTISVSACVLLILGYFISARLSFMNQVYFVISIIIVTLGYAGLLFFELYDPVWVFIERKWILTFFLLLTAYILYPHSFVLKLVVICLGTIKGEILFAMNLLQLDLHYVVASKEYLDILTLTCGVITIVHFINKTTLLFIENRQKKVIP